MSSRFSHLFHGFVAILDEMANLLDDEAGIFLVLVNEEGQHSLWPETIAVPAGWNAVHRPDTRQKCLAYIKAHWIDMRPESLRRASLNSDVVVPSLLPPAAAFLPDRLLLFCVPYAGASASVYRDWVHMAPEFLQVCPVELPGKGRLAREPFAKSLDTLARTISEEISAYADRPYAIFGHSMGALLTYEVAAQLESAGQPHPFRIFLSGALPPFLARNKRTVSDLPNAPFLDHLRELQGTSDAILDNRELMQFFLPVLRSDFRLCEEYEAREQHLLQVPVTALSGEQDEKTSEADMLLWKRATTGAFESRRYPGGHFFFTDPNVMWSVFDSLKGWQVKQRMSMTGASVRGA